MKIDANLEVAGRGSLPPLHGNAPALTRLRIPVAVTAWAELRDDPACARIIALFDRVPAVDTRLLRADAIELTPLAAPGLHALCAEAQRQLGVNEPITLMQAASRVCNAAVFDTKAPMVTFYGALVPTLTPAAALAVIGHELGHHIAAPHRSLERRAGALVNLLAIDAPHERLLDRGRIALLGNELFADRCGLLVGQSARAWVECEMVLAAGVAIEHVGASVDAYVAECTSYVDDLLRRRELALGETHPEHRVRSWAACRFCETDLFRELTGHGRGTLAIDELNAQLARLLDREVTAAQRPKPMGTSAEPSPSDEGVRGAANKILDAVAEGKPDDLVRGAANKVLDAVAEGKTDELVEGARRKLLKWFER